MDKLKIKLILKDVLSDIETTVYLTSLEGSLTIQELARKAKINRSGTYRVVENLIEKGLLIKEIKPRGIKIIAEHPQKITKLLKSQQRKLRRKELAFDELLPEILSESNLSIEKPSIKIFENKVGLKNAYNLIIEECENSEGLALSGNLDVVFKEFNQEFWNDWYERFTQKDNTSRLIANKTKQAVEFAKNDSRYDRQTKIIEKFNLVTDINIFNDKVLVVSMKEKVAILIESKTISNSYRILFETIWKK